MSEPVYLGIDVGTTSTKCLAVSASGEVLALTRNGYGMSHPREGWAEQDPQDYWNALVSVIRQCADEIERSGHSRRDIRSISMSTQGDTLIVTDSAGQPLAPAISWMDSRGTQECRELVEKTGEKFWYTTTGIALTSFSSACKIRWIARRQPELFERIDRVCYVPDYLALRLCGEFITDVPSASWQPMFEPAKRGYSQVVMDLVGVEREKLADPLESGELVGELLLEAASELGLDAGVTLRAGAFDQAAAATGSGASPDGTSVLSCGTAWVLYSVSGSPIVDKEGRIPVCCHTRPNEWGMVAPFTGGAAYDWLGRNLREDETPTEPMEETSTDPPVFIPHLYGGLSPDWRDYSRGSILGLTMTHTSQDIRLALMRGLAFEARRNVEVVEQLAGLVRSVIMVGGATNSPVWPQMIANALNRPVSVSDFAESACYGAAKLAAGEAASDWKTPGSTRTLEPDPAGVVAEEANYMRYLRFYEAITPLYQHDI